MTTLDPALDKLRSKELSFWCFIETYIHSEAVRITELFDVASDDITAYNIWDELPHWEDIYCRVSVYSWDFWLNHIKNILWHPLTRGRIQLLMVGMEATLTEKMILNGVWIEEVEIVGWLYRIFKENTLYDQTEIERMTSPKRPELRELLIKFAEYIYLYNW